MTIVVLVASTFVLESVAAGCQAIMIGWIRRIDGALSGGILEQLFLDEDSFGGRVG